MGLVLGALRSTGGVALVYYFFMIFAVGPWFARLLGECLPVAQPPIRVAVANLILLIIFIVGIKLAEIWLEGPAAIYTTIAALLLWTPQYMICFLQRDPGSA